MARTLFFEQITDSRFEPIEECLTILQDRINKIKNLLNIEGVVMSVNEPYLIDWTETDKKYCLERAIENESMREYYLKEAEKKHIQYRANFKISKNTRKLKWNDIYGLVNSVKAVPYSFK